MNKTLLPLPYLFISPPPPTPPPTVSISLCSAWHRCSGKFLMTSVWKPFLSHGRGCFRVHFSHRSFVEEGRFFIFYFYPLIVPDLFRSLLTPYSWTPQGILFLTAKQNCFWVLLLLSLLSQISIPLTFHLSDFHHLMSIWLCISLITVISDLFCLPHFGVDEEVIWQCLEMIC